MQKKNSISAAKSDPIPSHSAQESEKSGFAAVESSPPSHLEQLLQ